jgi:hypothetical protein
MAGIKWFLTKPIHSSVRAIPLSAAVILAGLTLDSPSPPITVGNYVDEYDGALNFRGVDETRPKNAYVNYIIKY